MSLETKLAACKDLDAAIALFQGTKKKGLVPGFVRDWVSRKLGRRPRYSDKLAKGIRFKWASSIVEQKDVERVEHEIVTALEKLAQATGTKIVVTDPRIPHLHRRSLPCSCCGVPGFTVKVDDGVRRLEPCSCSRAIHEKNLKEWHCKRHGSCRLQVRDGFKLSVRAGG